MSEPVGITGATFTVHKAISKDGGAFTGLTNPIQEVGNGWYSIELTSSETNADKILLSLVDNSTGIEVAASALLETTTDINHSELAQQVWEYPDRVLTDSDCLKPDTIVPNESDLPNGPLTVLQALELLTKRFKRHKNTPKL